MTGGRLVLKMSLSLDGFVAGPEGEIDWIFNSGDAASTAWLVERLGQADLHIMGRRTFADMAAWWPTATGVFAAPMNVIPKAVFTRSGAVSSGTTTALRDTTAHRKRAGETVLPVGAEESWKNAGRMLPFCGAISARKSRR